MFFIGKANFSRFVFIGKRAAGIQRKADHQHSHRKSVVGRHHNGVCVKSVVGRAVQLGGEAGRGPAGEPAAQVGERVPRRQPGARHAHAEKYHADGPQHKHACALGPQRFGRGFLFGLAEAAVHKLFSHTVAGLQQPPDDKRQCVSVPEAGDKKHREHANFNRQALHFTTRQARDIGPGQRHKQIVLQPGRKADVPTAPEPGKVGGKKRGLEVFGQVQPQQQAHGARGLGIAGEVEIQLERVKHCRQDQHRPAVAAVVGEHLVHQQAQHITDGHHFKQAQCQQA